MRSASNALKPATEMRAEASARKFLKSIFQRGDASTCEKVIAHGAWCACG
jgi:hypothetical protein